MKETKTLLYLGTDQDGIFDASMSGRKIDVNARVKKLKRKDSLLFNKGGAIKINENGEFKDMDSFTIEALIKPRAFGKRMNIAEAQNPAVAFFIDDSGALIGSVHTRSGWQSVSSGSKKLSNRKEQAVRFIKDGNTLLLEIDGKVVGRKVISEKMTHVGDRSFFIGSWVDGKRYSFYGTMTGVRITKGASSSGHEKQIAAREHSLEKKFKTKFKISRIKVFLDHDVSYNQLQPIKNILTAVGVQTLSELSELKITSKVVMTPGKVMVAPKTINRVVNIDWPALAKSVAGLDKKKLQLMLAGKLINRNSVNFIKKEVGNAGSAGTSVSHVHTGVFTHVRPGMVSMQPGAGHLSINTLKKSMRNVEKLNISHAISIKDNKFVLKDANLLGNLTKMKPAGWPATKGDTMKLLSVTTLPVDSAVIVAGTFNLHNTELVIEPEVSTLYIIAEKIICSANSKITWRRPGGSTPPRADNPGLNGRSYSGVVQKPNSYDGCDGGDGLPGINGAVGSKGLSAPNIEVWVKDMNSMPDFDLNGEDGIKGGRGQRGGRGGNGANGRVGRIKTFLWETWCHKDPGDGGDGGDGGKGGNGGRGGNGGSGGDITIGVLDGTLESTVTSKSFKIKNQGGQKGRGGERGEGGNGGFGGRSGAGKYCKDADDGHNGAKGQPGTAGSDGYSLGQDGKLTFFEFSENAWEDLLTRPWISDTEPDYLFPGDTLRIKGSRFTQHDKVVIGGTQLAPTINADESLTVQIPATISGGEKSVYVKRQDGTESNRLRIWIKPQLNQFTEVLMPDKSFTVNGKAFLSGAQVILNGQSLPTTFVSATELRFENIGTGGQGSAAELKTMQVVNPDGMMSNVRTAYTPDILEVPFKFNEHALPFGNFDNGSPSWDTYCDTFGSLEIWHEQLDIIFGHPILTAAFYGFYHYFLKGESNGGLATGYCTALSSIVLNEFWQGSTDTYSRYSLNSATRKMLTGVHGKLLSRESLIHFHDQGQQGNARVLQTYREIEHVFYNGCDRHNAPMLFFIPSGAIWDSGYIDKLGSTHCIVPIRFVYPQGHSGPKADGTTDPAGVKLYCWDCNQPYDPDPANTDYENCYLEFRSTDGEIRFDYYAAGNRKFWSEDGITLGMMSHGDYHLADHDLPFSGPLGLTSFVIDFLLSPADIQITDESGLRTGLFGNQLLAEIPDSRPCFMAKGAYMLPADTALTRKFTGTGTGKYTFNTITPDGTSLVIEDMDTTVGQEDVLAVNADGTQIRFSPGVSRSFKLTIARQVEDEIRAIAVEGIGGGPAEDVDITLSPELSLCRVGNRSTNKTINVRAFAINSSTQAHTNIDRGGVALPSNHDLVLAVTDWVNLDLTVEAVPFE